MGKVYFITGTDTDAGKTVVTSGLLAAAEKQGLKALALKPVAAGCEMTDEGLRNQDALTLMDAATIELPYEQVNPYALAPAIAPHIAAREAGIRMTIDRLSGYCRGALMKKHDLALIEGAGGWRVPLNDREFFSGLPKALNTPVIMVVGMKLGCINHSILTVESILRDGMTLAGWIANRVDANMSCYDENLQTLKSIIPAPCLGDVPWLENDDKDSVAEYLNLPPLI